MYNLILLIGILAALCANLMVNYQTRDRLQAMLDEMKKK